MIVAEGPGLFDDPRRAHAEARRDLGLARAGSHADRVDPSWREGALAALRAHARANRRFMLEDVAAAHPTPASVDPRAWGTIAQDARRRGWIRADGYAPANSSNRSPKVRWLSLLADPEAAP